MKKAKGKSKGKNANAGKLEKLKQILLAARQSQQGGMPPMGGADPQGMPPAMGGMPPSAPIPMPGQRPF